MQLGFSTMNNLQVMRPDDLGRALEERGFDSIWVGEHSHIPLNSGSPYPDGKLPEPYRRMADLYVSLGAIAAVTTTLKLATGVTLLLERDVFGLAKAVATLDQLSRGRVILGIGVGWNEKELANVSPIPWKRRYAGMRECVTVLRTLWREEEPSHAGEFYRFDKVWSYPKPVQKPHPKIVLGVAGRLGIRHAAEYGDGWYPLDMGLKDYGPRIQLFRDAVKSAERDPAALEISVSAAAPDEARLARYRELGVQRAVISSGQAGATTRDDMLRLMDRYAKLIPGLAG